MQRSALCRSRRELSDAYLLAKFGFDTTENEPGKVCRWQQLTGDAELRPHEAEGEVALPVYRPRDEEQPVLGGQVAPAQQRATLVDDEVLGAHTRWL